MVGPILSQVKNLRFVVVGKKRNAVVGLFSTGRSCVLMLCILYLLEWCLNRKDFVIQQDRKPCRDVLTRV